MQQKNRQEQRRAQRVLFGLDDPCDDPFHPLARRREDDRVREYAQFMTFPDRMVIDFTAHGDPDFTTYCIHYPARALVQADFAEKVETVMRGPGDSDEAQKIGLAFVAYCRANPEWSARLQDAARRRLEWGV